MSDYWDHEENRDTVVQNDIELMKKELRNLRHINNMAKDLLSTYTFKLGAVLDSNRRCVSETNRVQLLQLQRALEDYK